MKTPQLMKNSLRLSVYAIVLLLATDNLLFGAQGIRYVTNFLGSGLNYVDQYSTTGTGANLGVATASIYTSRNGNWFPYPVDNKNYIRGDSYLSGKLYDEQNSAYYVDPATTSNLNTLAVNGGITGPAPTAASNLATKAYVDAATVAGAGGGTSSGDYIFQKMINNGIFGYIGGSPYYCNSIYFSGAQVATNIYNINNGRLCSGTNRCNAGACSAAIQPTFKTTPNTWGGTMTITPLTEGYSVVIANPTRDSSTLTANTGNDRGTAAAFCSQAFVTLYGVTGTSLSHVISGGWVGGIENYSSNWYGSSGTPYASITCKFTF